MKKFVIKISLFSLFLAFSLFGINYIIPKFTIVPFYFFSILFFTALTTLVYSMLVRGINKNNKQFINAFYFTTIIRLFGSLVVVLIYFLANKKSSLYEAVVFIVLYFLYTGFEIVNLFPTLRPEIEENPNK